MKSRSNKKPAGIKSTCPCGARATFELCCGPRLDGRQPADTAEALMRSRYTAFTLENAPYLLASWHPDTRPTEMTFDATQVWLRLTILARDKGTQLDATGMVEFVARYKVNGKAHKLHELSRFGRVDSHWVYIDGAIDEALADDNAQ